VDFAEPKRKGALNSEDSTRNDGPGNARYTRWLPTAGIKQIAPQSFVFGVFAAPGGLEQSEATIAGKTDRADGEKYHNQKCEQHRHFPLSR
jgi:hypothetical protein